MSGDGKNVSTSDSTSTGTTTSNLLNSNSPYAPAIAPLNSVLNSAMRYQDMGMGGNAYMGQRVADRSASTMGGMSGLEALAASNMGNGGLSQQYQNIINRGGFTGDQANAVANMRQVANSQFNINDDPGFKQVADQARDYVNANASAAGRYGSGTHQGALVSQIGDLGARQFNNWQARQDAANQGLFAAGQTGIGNIGTAFTGAQAPAQLMMNIGGQRDAYQQRLLDAARAQYDESELAPWQNLSRLYQIASGIGGLGGTSATTQSGSTSSQTTGLQEAPGQDPFMKALGYGATGLGLLGGF